MKLGSLFSGGGLGDFGFLAAGMEIAWQCEIDKYCQEILQLRYPESKKYRDIKTLKGEALERVDIITGGFPCQPFSVAGKQRGKDDNRYLWPEMLRVIAECRPRWVVGENVPGIINMALDTVCADLEAQGYEVWPIVFPSHALGAWHKRDRIWIICHSKSEQDRRIQQSRIQSNIGTTSFKNSRRGSFTEEGNFGVCEYECNNSGICANPEHWYVADTTSRDHKDGSAKSCQNVPVNSLLGRAVHYPTPRATRGGSSTETVNQMGISGTLNPQWVEWLMGLPIGYTDLKCSETAKFLLARMSLEK